MIDRDRPPTRYEIVDQAGNVHASFADAADAARWASRNMPGEQDTGDELEPTGWDIRLTGCDRAPEPPYPFCRTPEKCAGKGYCPADIACND